MLNKYKEFKFLYAYDLAGYIHKLFHDDPEDEYLRDHFDVNDSNFINIISIPNKNTLLHSIVKSYWIEKNEYYHHHFDYEDIIVEFENIINTYSIKNQNKPDILENNEQLEKYCDTLLNLVNSDCVINRVVNEIFTILFNDRLFLLKLNLICSDVVKLLKKDDYPKILDKDGKLKRCPSIPVWLKKAIMYRDKGKCQICGKDLSGVWTTENEIQYDYVVPLNLGGCVTNRQIFNYYVVIVIYIKVVTELKHQKNI